MKAKDELLEELYNNESLLCRIERLVKCEYVICIKNYAGIIDIENIRNRKSKCKVGDRYRITFHGELIRIEYSDGYGISGDYFNIIDRYYDGNGVFDNIFDYFVLESEWNALQRENKIDEILG